MPKIGARMVKTSVAVFLCFVLYRIRNAGIPFYSAIAAVLCTQPEMNESLSKGKSRIIGTCIGGFAGMGMLFLFQPVLGRMDDMVRYGMISLMLIPLIQMTVWIKQPDSSYLSCVVFLCVTISHAGDADPFFFAINRMVDTLIGIFIAIGVNAFHLPHQKHKDILIEVPLNYLIDEQKKISTYVRVHLNRLIKEGAHIMIQAQGTPSQMLPIIKYIEEPLTCILMEGALRYERATNACVALYTIPYASWHPLAELLESKGYSLFLYEVKDELLYIHHGPYQHVWDRAFYTQEYKEEGQRYVTYEQAVSKQISHDIISMMILIKEEQLSKVQQCLLPYMNDVTWVLYEHPYGEQEKMLRIYSQRIASQDPALAYAKEIHCQAVYKVRHFHHESEKQLLHEISHVFYHGN